MPFPVKPAPEVRNNCNMHNYRKQVEEYACDSTILFHSFTQRLTGKDAVRIPVECIAIVSGPRNYCREE